MFKIEEIESLEYEIYSKDLKVILKQSKNIKNFMTKEFKMKNISLERFEKLLKDFNNLKKV